MPASRSCCTARVEFRGTGGLQFSNPEYEIIRGEADDDDSDDPHGTHRAGLREGRIADAAHAAHAGASAAGGDAGDDSRSACRRRSWRGTACPAGAQALADVHFPAAGTNVDALNARATPAQRRLIFEEFFLFQAGMVLRKRRHAADRKPRAVVVDDRIRESARRALPFKLTAGQKAGAARDRDGHAACRSR